MKITTDRNVVEFVPENEQETASLEVLWRIIVDCMRENKSLTPIGEYIPSKNNLARFVIEGVPGGKTEFTETIVEEDSTYLCTICNKYMNTKKGDSVPLCCGREMETVD